MSLLNSMIQVDLIRRQVRGELVELCDSSRSYKKAGKKCTYLNTMIQVDLIYQTDRDGLIEHKEPRRSEILCRRQKPAL